MSDNLRLYRAIRKALHQLCPVEPKGDFARHLTTLSMMICGIVASQKAQLPAMARKIPDETHPDSREKRMIRWLKNGRITLDRYYLPFARALLGAWPSSAPLALVLDASEVGRGCCVWMVSVIYKKRALPLVWMAKKVKKGHASEETHLELLRMAKAILPESRRVVFLGDGEFDGVGLQAALRERGRGLRRSVREEPSDRRKISRGGFLVLLS